MKRNLALALLSIIAPFTYSEAAHADPLAWAPPPTLSAIGGLGWTDGFAARIGVEGKGWVARHFGVGGKALYGATWGGARILYMAEPEVFMAFGSRKVRWLSFVGAELGAVQQTVFHNTGWLCIDPCPPARPPTVEPWAFVAGATVGTGVEYTTGWFMLGTNIELEANMRGVGGIANLTMGVSSERH